METAYNKNSTGHIVDYTLQEELNHGIYVSKLMHELGKELQLNPFLNHELTIAGVFHDIGKLELNRYIYSESDTLMVEEMKYVRMHSKIGYEILKSRDYSELILQVILHHHENYDGSGYPDNLSGEEIPLGARMLRVCDVFAALTSERPYRKSFDCDTTMELMIDEVKNFDIEIFLAFQRVVHSYDIKHRNFDFSVMINDR